MGDRHRIWGRCTALGNREMLRETACKAQHTTCRFLDDCRSRSVMLPKASIFVNHPVTVHARTSSLVERSVSEVIRYKRYVSVSFELATSPQPLLLSLIVAYLPSFYKHNERADLPDVFALSDLLFLPRWADSDLSAFFELVDLSALPPLSDLNMISNCLQVCLTVEMYEMYGYRVKMLYPLCDFGGDWHYITCESEANGI